MATPVNRSHSSLLHFSLPLSSTETRAFSLPTTQQMAANLITFRAVGIHSCAVPSHPKPEAKRRKTSSSTNWWSPLFGWASEPDYIESYSSEHKKESEPESDPELQHLRSRFAPGCFTEEKAKQLRMLTSGSSSYNDVMYHSAIASRLASDFKNRSDLQTYDDH